MSPAPHGLLGRDDEFARLIAAIRSGARIIVVRGPRGIGKSTLATETYRFFEEVEMSMGFVGSTVGHKMALPSVLIDFLDALGGQPAGLTSAEALVGELTAAATSVEGRGLYYVDNLEPDVFFSQAFENVCRAWLSVDHNVCLMVTVRDDPPYRTWPLSGDPTVFDLKLGGLTDDTAQLSLLGEEIRRAHSDAKLIELATRLDGNPQLLLAFRWSRSDPDGFLHSIQKDDRIWDDPSSFADWLLSTGLDELCLALGVTRVIEYDVDLLKYLWEHGRSATQTMSADEAVDLLVVERVLSPAARPDALRVHPWVHRDLALLAEPRSRPWTQRVHAAAADYFLQSLSASDTESASEYVFHALTAGRAREVWSRLVGDDLVEAWRRRGRSVHAMAIVDELLSDVRRRRVDFSAVERAELLVKRAYLASDMGQPRVCIDYLELALQELAGIPGKPAMPLRRAIWTQLAISHANLGETDACMLHYRKAIDADRTVEDPRTALAMGYLAYEYCDVGKLAEAKSWIDLALEKCPRTRDASIFAKNLCNQGLVRFFDLDLGGAAVSFEEAINLVSEPGGDGFDVREHGRVLAHRGMVMLAMARADPAEALSLLEDAQALNEQAGDRRRVYVSMGRQGIAHARLGNMDTAWRLLTRAADAHQRLGDTRNLALEVLAMWALPALSADGLNEHAMPALARRVASGFQEGGPLARYAEAWNRAYCLMLDPTGSLSRASF